MCATLLKEFVTPVPTCPETADLLVLWDLFVQTQADQIIVLGEQGQPTGLVRASQLFPYLMALGGKLHQGVLSLRLDLNRSLQTCEAAIVEAVSILSAELSLSQVRSAFALQWSTDPHWVLVDGHSEVLGVLDAPRLLKGWVLNSAAFTTPTEPAATTSTAFSFWTLSAATASLNGDERPAEVRVLAELLNELPFPVMLQTGSGGAITQNRLWQDQIGELQDAAWVMQEATVLLEPLSYPAIEAPSPLWEAPSNPLPASVEPLVVVQEPAGSCCEKGPEPNTCICACVTKNGLERIWQFTKIPLHLPWDDTQSSLEPSRWQGRLTALGGTLSPTDCCEQPTLIAAESTSGETSPTLWLMLAQDVTEQHQVARELAAKNADLIQLNRLKDEFLSCISHELKTPLTAVLGLSSLLKDQVLGELNERQGRYARLIHQSGRHLMAIVNDILDLTRIETGQLDLILEPVSLPGVCEAAKRLAYSNLLGHKLEPPAGSGKDQAETEDSLAASGLPDVTIEFDPDLDMIIADETRLRQMLVHLLGNALKFTDATGSVGLRVNRWEAWIAFTIWDTGIGIPADKQHLIFQKFQQLENPLTRRFEGTGLGLVLTQRLARLHGGDVTFMSREGEGSQFTLLLPPIPPANHHHVRKLSYRFSQSNPSPSRLVLIVEGMPQFIDHLTEHLGALGYHVAIARSGTEALEKARRLQPCVIFLNPLLPLLSGWDVLTLLKSDAETRQIPVVVTTTWGDKKQAVQYRADGFLNLPIQSKVLEHTLAHLLEPTDAIGTREASANLTLIVLSVDARPTPQLTQMLQCHHHRVLEVDDLSQAELLARVWKPQAVILQGAVEPAIDYMQELSRCACLSILPLVILSPEMTRAANQVSGLSVFPCLPTQDCAGESSLRQIEPALLQVIQMVAGANWKPVVMMVDLSDVIGESARTEGAQTHGHPDQSRMNLPPTLSVGQEIAWLQMLTQYLQAAGLKSTISRSWAEALRQLQGQCVDLLLVRLPRLDGPPAKTKLHLQETIAVFTTLTQLQPKPPILVLNGPANWDDLLSSTVANEVRQLEALLQSTASQVLSGSISMQALLNQIEQLI